MRIPVDGLRRLLAQLLLQHARRRAVRRQLPHDVHACQALLTIRPHVILCTYSCVY